MADSTSGDHPVESTNGAIEGQRKSITPGSEAVEDEQTLAQRDQTIVDADRTGSDSDHTLADADQTGSDSDQTLADTDQTSADRDQASADRDQLAADRDQAASDRDLASGVDPHAHEASRDIRERTARERERSAQARVDAADQRDLIACARDLAALARDKAAYARDLALDQQDASYGRQGGAGDASDAEILIGAAAQRRRAADHRTQAAEHRVLAAGDRRAAAEDREQAARERLQALTDRKQLARELAIAETDALTGARTRAAGLIDLDHELDRCRRTSGLLVVAYVDVVGLKTINDSQGHGAGDKLLQRVVALIRGDLRPYDLIIRLGGDEFLCAMSNMTLLDARQRFGAIGAALAAAPGAGAIRTGFAEFAPEQTAKDLIARADSELLDNRRAGRAPLVADASPQGAP